MDLSDFNRPTFPDHRRAVKSSQKIGFLQNFWVHVDGLEKWGDRNLWELTPQESADSPPAIWFAAWAEPHRPIAPANSLTAKVC